MADHSFSLAQKTSLQLEVFWRSFDHQIGTTDFLQSRHPLNALQYLVSIRLRNLFELNCFGEVPFDRLPAASQRLRTNVTHNHSIARRRCHLGDTMTHGARAEHSYGMNWASHSRIIVFVRAFAQNTLNKGAEPKKWGS